MVTRPKQLLEFAARTRVLVTTGIIAATLLLAVFLALPIGGDLLDARFGYTHATTMEAMAVYGEDGRRAYLWASLTLDTLLPVAYVGFLAGILHRLRPRKGLGKLTVVPVAAGLLDLSENVQIAAMLASYPEVSAAQVGWASAATQSKACALLASMVLVAGFVVLALVGRWRRRFHEP